MRPQIGGGELSAVPGKEDARKLAREVRASFRLPWWLWGIGFKGGHSQGSPCTTMPLQKEVYAPSQLNLLHVGTFKRSPGKKWWHMPGPSSIGQSKTIHLLEVSSRLLSRSVLELREEVRWYLSFTNEEVFWGVALPKGRRGGKSADPWCYQLPQTHCMPEPAPEGRAPKFVGWKKVLHPS